MMANAFYFILKAFFVLKIFKFLSWLFGHVNFNSLIREIWLTLKFITSQPGKQTIAIDILPNILRSKGNQIMKIDELIECNMTNIFLEKSNRKCGGDPFLKSHNWWYFWINRLRFYTVSIYCMLSWGLSKYIETKLQTTYFYLFFKK